MDVVRIRRAEARRFLEPATHGEAASQEAYPCLCFAIARTRTSLRSSRYAERPDNAATVVTFRRTRSDPTRDGNAPDRSASRDADVALKARRIKGARNCFDGRAARRSSSQPSASRCAEETNRSIRPGLAAYTMSRPRLHWLTTCTKASCFNQHRHARAELGVRRRASFFTEFHGHANLSARM